MNQDSGEQVAELPRSARPGNRSVVEEPDQVYVCRQQRLQKRCVWLKVRTKTTYLTLWERIRIVLIYKKEAIYVNHFLCCPFFLQRVVHFLFGTGNAHVAQEGYVIFSGSIQASYSSSVTSPDIRAASRKVSPSWWAFLAIFAALS